MKGFKTLMMLMGISGLSSTAYAGWEGNWLVGVSGGYENRAGDMNIYLVDNQSAVPLDNQIIDADDKGFIWGFLGGYQARCNGWLFGIELNVDWHDNHKKHNFFFVDGLDSTFAPTIRYERETNVGLTGRFGRAISDFFLAYIRLGAETSEDELHLSFDVESSRRQYRFVGGLGAEMPFFLENLTLRTEYNYHSKGRRLEVNAVTPNNSTLYVVDAKPQTHVALASLVWNFI